MFRWCGKRELKFYKIMALIVIYFMNAFSSGSLLQVSDVPEQTEYSHHDDKAATQNSNSQPLELGSHSHSHQDFPDQQEHEHSHSHSNGPSQNDSVAFFNGPELPNLAALNQKYSDQIQKFPKTPALSSLFRPPIAISLFSARV